MRSTIRFVVGKTDQKKPTHESGRWADAGRPHGIALASRLHALGYMIRQRGRDDADLNVAL